MGWPQLRHRYHLNQTHLHSPCPAEFTTAKSVSRSVTPAAIEALDIKSPNFPKPWLITIDGLVEQPLTIDVKDLLSRLHMGEWVAGVYNL